MKEKWNGEIDIQHLAEGGDGGGAAATGAESQGVAASAAQPERKPVYRTKRGTPIYDQDEPQQQAVAVEEPQEESKPEDTYESLVRGKEARFRKEYDEDVQSIVRDRIRKTKDLNDRMTPLINAVAQRYGIDTADMSAVDFDALMEKFVGDPQLNAERALESGRTPEEEGMYQVLQQRSQELERLKRESAQEMVQRQKFEQMARDAAALKQEFPDFDIRNHLNNEQFMRMYDTGVPMRAVYIALNPEVVTARATADAEAKLSASVQAGARRPRENGASTAQAASAVAMDPTSKEFRDYVRKELAAGRRPAF